MDKIKLQCIAMNMDEYSLEDIQNMNLTTEELNYVMKKSVEYKVKELAKKDPETLLELAEKVNNVPIR